MNKKLYINSSTLQKMDIHSISDLNNEVGGFLVGRIEDNTTYIEDFIPAISGESKSTSFKFTNEDWKSLYSKIDKNVEIELIGWFHTHPNFGAFLSTHDEFIQNNFFSDEGRVAVVFDPIRHQWSAFVQSEHGSEEIKLKTSEAVKIEGRVETKKRGLIISILLSLVFSFYSGYLYLNSLELKSKIVNVQNELEGTITSKDKLLESTKENLENEIISVGKQNNENKDKIKILDSEIIELDRKYSDLELDYQNIQIENTKLEEDSKFINYVVKQDDTLKKIASFFGTSVDSIYSLNKEIIGPDVNTIEVGEILIINIDN